MKHSVRLAFFVKYLRGAWLGPGPLWAHLGTPVHAHWQALRTLVRHGPCVLLWLRTAAATSIAAAATLRSSLLCAGALLCIAAGGHKGAAAAVAATCCTACATWQGSAAPTLIAAAAAAAAAAASATGGRGGADQRRIGHGVGEQPRGGEQEGRRTRGRIHGSVKRQPPAAVDALCESRQRGRSIPMRARHMLQPCTPRVQAGCVRPVCEQAEKRGGGHQAWACVHTQRFKRHICRSVELGVWACKSTCSIGSSFCVLLCPGHHRKQHNFSQCPAMTLENTEKHTTMHSAPTLASSSNRMSRTNSPSSPSSSASTPPFAAPLLLLVPLLVPEEVLPGLGLLEGGQLESIKHIALSPPRAKVKAAY
eukprot:1158945-Pelagomonas_calceolata.AAC.3